RRARVAGQPVLAIGRRDRRKDDVLDLGERRHLAVLPAAPVVASDAPSSDRLAVPEELVILVVAAVTAADVTELGDDLDRADPLHLLEPELDLVAQPDRRAVRDRERFAVHLEREQRQLAV